ncbi:MAG: DNA polymerase III subunit delta [Rickettsiales bacterium]|jgi:DNA polymerase-3 subunit delta|nr:DNA polymerase III subunit delta [Rickettsiales bacterium]
MKWKEIDLDTAVANKMAGLRGVLLAGQDAGKISENAGRIVKSLGLQKDCIIKCALTELKSDSDRLFAEACSDSLFGDRRGIVITDATATKGDANVIMDLCREPTLSAFVIVQAGDMKKDAELKKFFEAAADFASVDHYLDTERDLPNIIKNILSAEGVIDISRDAMVYMSRSLGGDRGQTRRALEKLAMFVQGRKVELEDAVACIGDSGAAAIDQLLYSATAGRASDTASAFDRLIEDKIVPAQIIRALSRHLKTLLAAKSSNLPPVVFWKYRDLAAEAWKLWTPDRLSQVLARVPEVEKDLRGSKSEEAVLSKFCLDIAVYAAKFKKR